MEKEELIESMIEGFNKAIEDADHVNENEMKSTAFKVFPEWENKCLTTPPY